MGKSVDAGVQEEGKSEEKPASKETEQTADDGVITLDVTKKYASKRNPGEEISGDKLWAGYGRGQQYDALMSTHQKLQTKATATETKLAEAEGKLAEVEAQKRTVQALKAWGITGQKPVAESGDDWLDDTQKPTAPQVDPAEIAKRQSELIQSEVDRRLSPEAIEEYVDQRLSTIYDNDKQVREAQAARERTAGKIRQAHLAKLQVDNPDADEQELKSIVDAEEDYTAHLVAALELGTQGEERAAIEQLLDGIEIRDVGLGKRLEIMKKQAEVNTLREREAELEGLETGSLPGEEPEEENAPAYKKADTEKKREGRLARAKKLIDRRKTLKNSGAL